MKKFLLAALLLGAVAPFAHAQLAPDFQLPNLAAKGAQMQTYDLNHDGKISDWEVEKVNERMLNGMDLNHDGRIDEKDRRIAKQMIKQMKAEERAEIKKWDKNGDGKLDDAENAARVAAEAAERAKQKPSQAASELSKPMVNY